jgi:hypothetical protein
MEIRKRCWKYFNCPPNTRDNCPVYLNNDKISKYCDGWVYFDVNIGGPANNGPCINCGFNKMLISEYMKPYIDK